MAATNTDHARQQREGGFGNDLYYRLCTHHIAIPPLREQMEELPLLIDHFTAQTAAETLQKKVPAISAEFYQHPANNCTHVSEIFITTSRNGGKPLPDITLFQLLHIPLCVGSIINPRGKRAFITRENRYPGVGCRLYR